MDKKTIKRLLTYCKPYRFLIMLLTLLSIVSVVFTLLTPVLIGQAIDLLVGKNQVHFQALLNKLIFIGIVILIISLIQWIMGQITNTITYNITNDLRNRVFDQIQVLPLKYIDATSHGDILGRLINDIDLIGQGLLQSFTSLLTGIATIVGTILIMAYIHFSVAVIVVVLTPLSLLVASLIVKRTHSYFQEQLALRGEMNGYCEEMIGNQKIVNIFDYQEQNEEKFNEINERMHKSGVISQFYGALINPTTRLVNSIVYAAVGIFGAFQVLNGSFTVGILSSFLTYANQYTKPFNEISSVMSEMQTAIAASQRVFALLDEETIQELTTSKIIENKQGHIIIDHLNFSYDPSKPLIQDFNYEAKPGTMTAIVGKTGCGKTTLINLLMRFYDPQGGKITIDDVNIEDMNREDLRKMYGMVLQDSWLFKGTIKENIAYGKTEASDEEIIEMLKDRKAIVLYNKTDLVSAVSMEALKEKINHPLIPISAKEETGIAQLADTIKSMFFSGKISFNDEVYITNARHKEALEEAADSLAMVKQSIEDGMPEDFFSIDLMAAYGSLGKITGEEVGEDLLNEIFSKFCMGK